MNYIKKCLNTFLEGVIGQFIVFIGLGLVVFVFVFLAGVIEAIIL
jgi:hypothetical protein